jgi:hypothetical protein
VSHDVESQVTKAVSKRVPRKDTLLAHCLARAVIADRGGMEAAMEEFGPRAERLSKWVAVKAAVKATPKASRVAGFIIMWAIAMREERRDSFSITEYQRFWNEGERQAYRLQAEFRGLWPEFETPNELAAQVVPQLDEKVGAREAASLTSRVVVTA